VQIEEERMERTNVENDLKKTMDDNFRLKEERVEMINNLTKMSAE
jgi:hypothetical protein